MGGGDGADVELCCRSAHLHVRMSARHKAVSSSVQGEVFDAMCPGLQRPASKGVRARGCKACEKYAAVNGKKNLDGGWSVGA